MTTERVVEIVLISADKGHRLEKLTVVFSSCLSQEQFSRSVIVHATLDS